MAPLGGSSVVSSLPPPRPKSPPLYTDLYGKRRELAKVQMLEREIGFLQEELKCVDGLQPASSCCKEVADFVVANSDPFLPVVRRMHRSCRFWKWLCGMSCFSISWRCCSECSTRLKMPRCCSECSTRLKMPRCCNFNLCIDCLSRLECSIPKCQLCCSWHCPNSQSFNNFSCGRSSSCCIILQCSSCPDCFSSSNCTSCTRCCLKCTNFLLCCQCTRNCCY